jgi:hypothetical protein
LTLLNLFRTPAVAKPRFFFPNPHKIPCLALLANKKHVR